MLLLLLRAGQKILVGLDPLDLVGKPGGPVPHKLYNFRIGHVHWNVRKSGTGHGRKHFKEERIIAVPKETGTDTKVMDAVCSDFDSRSGALLQDGWCIWVIARIPPKGIAKVATNGVGECHCHPGPWTKNRCGGQQ